MLRGCAEALEGGNDDDLQALAREANADRRNRQKPGCWIIGEPLFVRDALAHDKERRLHAPAYAESGWSLDKLARAVEIALGLEREELRKRGRGNLRAEARNVFGYYAVRRLEFTGKETALWLGISAGAVSRMLDQGERIAGERESRLVN